MIVEAAFTLLMLVLIQAVLGFDNLLYISLESRRAPKEDQARVRTIGIAVAVILRIVLLLVIVGAYKFFADWKWTIPDNPAVTGYFKFASIIELIGGGFILYTAVKEIFHMISHIDLGDEHRTPVSPKKIIAMIVFVNLIFSFDSILAAIKIATDGGVIETLDIVLMATAIIIGGILMIVLATRVTNFLEKNRIYQVLGLFVLFLVGVMLVSEGGSHLQIFGYQIEAMSKPTFYFVLFALIIVDVVQTKYQKNLIATEKLKRGGGDGSGHHA